MKKLLSLLLISSLVIATLTSCGSSSSYYSSSSGSYDSDTDWSGAAEAYAVGKARYDAMTGQ